MQYFKHMSNMRNDIKIKRLIGKYGLEGYGLYNLILESITESLTTESPLPQLQETCIDIAEFYNIDTYKAEEIVNFCVCQNLFEKDEVSGRIFCNKLYKFLEQSQTRSNEIRKLISEYKSYSDKIDNVYIMKNGDNYKIGKSLYPEKRLSEINKKMPGKTELLMFKKTEYGYQLENELHKLFSDKRIKNEWFALEEDDLKMLIDAYGFSVYEQSLTEVKEQNKNRKEQKRTEQAVPDLKQIEDYVKLKNLNIDPLYFYEYFTEGNWYDSKGNKVRNWKLKALTWDKMGYGINKNKQSEYPEL